MSNTNVKNLSYSVMQNLRRSLWWFLILVDYLLLSSSSFAQSTITARISEQDLNTVVNTLSLSGTESKQGPAILVPNICYKDTPVGKVPYPCTKEAPAWSITIDWWIRDLNLDIIPGKILISAKAHAEGKNFSYTDDIQGEASAKIDGSKLLIDIISLKATIYFKDPISQNRVKLKDVDIARFIKDFSIELPIEESYTINVPQAGDKKFLLGNKKLQIENEFISVTGQFSLSNP